MKHGLTGNTTTTKKRATYKALAMVVPAVGRDNVAKDGLPAPAARALHILGGVTGHDLHRRVRVLHVRAGAVGNVFSMSLQS